MSTIIKNVKNNHQDKLGFELHNKHFDVDLLQISGYPLEMDSNNHKRGLVLS